jgi:adenine-specific DNA-methyltransferase
MGADLLERIEFFRLDANRGLEEKRKVALGQFMTPAPVARFMASMLEGGQDELHLLDAGAGVGSLFAAAVAELVGRAVKPRLIAVTAFEIDAHLAAYLPDTLALCRLECEQAGVCFEGQIVQADFLASAANQLSNGLFSATKRQRFNCAILNPPYGKIRIDSQARRQARAIGIETSNVYTSFLAAAVRLLDPGGELVAITPRSFCNGSYFRVFREFFLREMVLRHLHIFESRQQAFHDDEVLQENLILRAVRRPPDSRRALSRVTISASAGPDDDLPLTREINYEDVVRPGDPQSFIHVAADDLSQQVVERMSTFRCALADLGLRVSTGRVVDFRAKQFLRDKPEEGTAPLVWPTHFDRGYIAWPKEGVRKPEAIAVVEAVWDQLVPNEHYVLVRRFSAKEERRRVVAAIYDAGRVQAEVVGFENHLNYFHHNGRGLDLPLARGLAAFLNSTLVDAYFRQFNGHTQVNATDLRSLKYPTVDQLRALGQRIGAEFPEQSEVDALLAREIIMADSTGIDPVQVRQKIEEATSILRAFGFPRNQLNERSALTLLALLGLKPETAWSKAAEPLCGITPMMDFFRAHYGKAYKPNTRETVRRQTVHQFLEAGLIVANPDEPERPVNSPKAVYQIETSALKLLRTFGRKSWDKGLSAYLSSIETLRQKYAQEREMARIPVSLAPGKEITLSPGGKNVLVKEIIDHFAPRFASPGRFIYVGDTAEKFAYFDEDGLNELGVEIEQHGKMPDVIVYHTEKNWLLLIEAVTSHGPIDPKRREELQRLFAASQAGLVFVTAFLTRKTMIQYLDDISWETEVWLAESPTHMIHFNGKRFLGPYSES